MRRARNAADLGDRTIADFGAQWTRYTDNDGYYGSVDVLADIFGPLLPLSHVRGRSVADIGSGTGRIVRMLLAAGAARIVALEPSLAVEVLRRNLAADQRVEVLAARGDEIPSDLNLDLIVSIGVLHHIPDPAPVVAAAWRALRPGGEMLVWLYGREGNRLTVALIEGARVITTRLPHRVLVLLAAGCTLALELYRLLCRLLPFLPLADYMRNVFGRFSRDKRRLVVYDQLRPAYAKYYTQGEARDLLERAGFVDVKLYHRRSYSWTVHGRRPEE